jgi:hypothetical protein
MSKKSAGRLWDYFQKVRGRVALKKQIRGCVKAVSFTLAVLLLLGGFSEIFRFKYGGGIANFDSFYELPDNSVDVLVLGSSHAFEDIHPAILYKDYGIAAYDLCGSIQPFWNTYHFLVEALKTQRPRLILLEAYCSTFSPEYSDASRIIRNNYGLEWSENAINALKVSTPSASADSTEESFVDYLFRFNQYHSRYADLTKEDFSVLVPTGESRQILGAGLNTGTQKFESPTPDNASAEPQPLSEKTEEWYRKIIELCESEGLSLEIILTPYPHYASHKGKFATARAIAEGYGVPFTDFNVESTARIGLDYSTDFADSSHLNHRAVQKFNHFLGEWLSGRHELPDRREGFLWQVWQEAVVSYEYLMTNQKLKEITEPSEYLRLAADSEHLDYVVWVAEDGTVEFDTAALLSTVGMTLPDDIIPNRYALVSSDGYETTYQIGDGSSFYADVGFRTIDLSRNDDVLCDRKSTKVVPNGLNIVVIDHYHDVVVETIGINPQGEIVREQAEESAGR